MSNQQFAASHRFAVRYRSGRVVEFGLLAGICLPFLFSGALKLGSFGAAVAEVTALGLPMPALAAALTILIQLGGSAALILGRGWVALLGGLALAGFTLLATLIAHAFWNFDGPARMQQTNVFVEHLSIAFALVFTGWWRWRQAQQE